MDCWDCFDAQGIMCHGQYYVGIPEYTKSGIQGKGICCKPGSNDPLCDGSVLDCSMPSVELDNPNSKYADVLSAYFRNFQMFAYCPGLPISKCGLENSAANTIIADY